MWIGHILNLGIPGFCIGKCNVDQSITTLSPIERANVELLQHIFDKYATVEKNGKKYMTDSDFIRKYFFLRNINLYFF